MLMVAVHADGRGRSSRPGRLTGGVATWQVGVHMTVRAGPSITW